MSVDHTRPRGRLDARRSTLLVVDVQARLLPHLHEADHMLAHCLWLTRVAGRLGVPIIATEQYPQGLGPTDGTLAAHLPAAGIVSKIHFSAVTDGCLREAAGADREQWVVVGCESHVCVLQTVLDLLAQPREVYVVAEAVGSRRASDRELALGRMAGAGATLVSREMVAFEWLERAGTDLFREVHREFLR